MPSEHRDAQSSSSPAPHTDGGNALDTHEHAPVEKPRRVLVPGLHRIQVVRGW